jgi:hypothetical protein
MSMRSRSPGGRYRQAPAPASSPIDRDAVNGQMQDIFVVVKKLREEKSALEKALQTMAARTEAEEKRLIKDLCKSRVDLENLTELFRVCADGIDTKSTAKIPELPEAAVAKVVPAPLRPLLEADYGGDHSSAGQNLQQEIGFTRAAVNDSFKEYERMAEAGKGLVWDVERLNMIIQAYMEDLTKLKDEGSDMKANINVMRLKWRAKFAACRRWQDYTRRSHVLKFQEKLDEIQDAFDFEQAETTKELESLLEMIGTIRVRDNKVKLALFMKKMKNAVVYKVWRGWVVFHQMCQAEKYGADLDSLSKMAADKMAAMKNAETAAMLRCFIKRWQNRKIAVPFMTWADITEEKRRARMMAELDAQRAALFAKMQALEGSAVAQKLKLIFARLTGKMKDLTFRALVKHMQMGRIARMGDDERFKRLKVFLEAKLKGVKYSTFKCLERDAMGTKAMRIKNNRLAQRVAAFLEMKIKGLKYCQFNAFKRFFKDSKSDRAEADHLAKLIAERDSQSLQRLKIFLMGKEARLKYAFFSFWVKAMHGSTQARMEDALAEKRKKRKALEAKLAELEKQLGGGRLAGDIDRQLASSEGHLRDLEKEAAALEQDVAMARKRLKEVEAALKQEQMSKRDDKDTISKLEHEIKEGNVDKEGLEHELSLIVDQIGFLSQYSK